MRISHILFTICLLSAVFFLPSSASAKVKGRYVHIVIQGYGKVLSLAEVEVFSEGKNVALRKIATQNQPYGDVPATAAVDGDTSSAPKTVTLSRQGLRRPSWEVDLGKEYMIDKIVIHLPEGKEEWFEGVFVNIMVDRPEKSVHLDTKWGRIVRNPGRKVELPTSLPWQRGLQLGFHRTFPGASAKHLKEIEHPRPKPPQWVLDGGVPPDSACGFSDGQITPPTPTNTPESLRRAIDDLIATHGDDVPNAKDFLARLEEMDPKDREGLDQLARDVLLSNPAVDFDKILLVLSRKDAVIGRRGNGRFVLSWQGNSNIPRSGFDNEIAVVDGLTDGKLSTVYKPERDVFVGNVDLHFNADKLLFATTTADGTQAVYEIGIDGKGFRQVSPEMGDDVDNYDPCYIPNGDIVFVSTAVYSGVPCVGGADYVGNLFRMDSQGENVRRLCFEQDHNWHPVMLPNGRVMYLRWEYTDQTHFFSRILMSMHPDGTDQKALYGSNSYWPNCIYFARPIPGSSTKFVGIVAGHHGASRSGAMVLFDVSKGNHETEGAVQIIPGWGEAVENKTLDGLSLSYLQHCVHPYPLSDKLFLASYRGVGNRGGNWGIYLFDVFDNMVCIKSGGGARYYEPIPLRKTPTPPVVPDRIIPGAKDATVFISNIYEGPGLAGIPQGTVKNLRVYKYEYGPRHSGGENSTGLDSSWDMHYVLGTVPVEKDGSAAFRVPANTPLALQPLDKDGRALQLMRSWFTPMPGESLSCIGCHEKSPSMVVPARRSTAMQRQPSEIKSWYGPVRGFSFAREMQPVVDKYCAGCHDGQPREDGTKLSDLSTPKAARAALHPYVRRGGPEGDNHLLTPLNFHANTSELVQMLEKGHHNVNLDDEAWARINTWIDMQAPLNGSWSEIGAKPEILQRRLELRKLYANIETDPEKIYAPYIKQEGAFVMPGKLERDVRNPEVAGFPFDVGKAVEMQEKAAGGNENNVYLKLDLGKNSDGKPIQLQLNLIPAGVFPMGSNSETPQEQPVTEVRIEEPFYMGTTEVSLEQYRQFDPDYSNGVYDQRGKNLVKRGYYLDYPTFPAVRISWFDAMRFCEWLSKKTGRRVTLPTEAQWEWAARAGTATPFYFGDLESDFSRSANLSDAKVVEKTVVLAKPHPVHSYELRDDRFNDGVLHLAPVGKYRPNPWGLHDMVGNIAEWTRTDYAAYPYDDNDDRNSLDAKTKKVLRGGSWHDRPFRATSSYRLGFPAWQRVYNAGFRVIVCEGSLAPVVNMMARQEAAPATSASRGTCQYRRR